MTTPLHPWHRPAEAPRHGVAVAVTPQDAGWTYAGLDVWVLAPGERRALPTLGVERAVLPLSGSYVVEVDGLRFDLDGRPDVFSRVTDWAYVPLGADATVTSVDGGEVALPSATATQVFPAAYVAAESVSVEVRGAGPATRQVTNFMSPDSFPGADRLMCVELLTPDGNWSSYPPHRHDGIGDCAVHNEEIYYFRIGSTAHGGYAPEGFAMHRTYSSPDDPHDEEIDVNLAVRDGDVFLIPRGYHGPCVAAPGYPLYYLNVLAGPTTPRTMTFCDDPTHHWVRESWLQMEVDPRVPMTSAAGSVGGDNDG
jgi:5-deoxy-glucuronate isomerase